MAVFNCLTQTQLCPHHKESVVTMGPFMVWPEGCNQGQKKLEMKTGRYDSDYNRKLVSRCNIEIYEKNTNNILMLRETTFCII